MLLVVVVHEAEAAARDLANAEPGVRLRGKERVGAILVEGHVLRLCLKLGFERRPLSGGSIELRGDLRQVGVQELLAQVRLRRGVFHNELLVRLQHGAVVAAHVLERRVDGRLCPGREATGGGERLARHRTCLLTGSYWRGGRGDGTRVPKLGQAIDAAEATRLGAWQLVGCRRPGLVKAAYPPDRKTGTGLAARGFLQLRATWAQVWRPVLPSS
mmetsp:Transcript_22262/g.56171  ORF Transcript_22262/g.56171 Transcript_22262/m.56171 type:complete len:215 (+) Transcript_22262:118-762(+)